MENFEQKVTQLLQKEEPFLFIIDFKKSKKLVYSFEEAARENIYFNIKGVGNDDLLVNNVADKKPILLKPKPISKVTYEKAFSKVKKEINNGNSFLLNLTFPTPLKPGVDLKEIYQKASAPYKLLYKDNFVLFSPECYLKIKDGNIFSYPMKGTISNDMPNAEELLLTNKKELYEHNTIVDLIRNDLSMIAKNVRVNKFRFVEKINKGEQELLQTSTEIQGKLPKTWKDNFASLLLKTLPAGSISGAPKKKTIDIIEQVEIMPRGFYTGVFGVFDGHEIDSAVNIRFIEHINGQYYYKSGGGITHLSSLDEEYQELLEKIYVPTF
ncbi:aminodeoxychorismate synthase component I [Maribacter hydrothermalis]|uniref:Aminodeoxychorismate synthase component I n=1 Tax=Maribacter hydrothermalis TaxID=1836467 RepID=A0A1B7ZDN2_9FLAO|nr:aminodeoxychorismate synthase component I [Maribacter hydrothermalis]APQ16638.1 aminodeoxychorismate synthase component I [Maribacter hydrothermalis]OBR41457.1 aminodeoxychorismate synthase component I [Maribacter hydrothermalis]